MGSHNVSIVIETLFETENKMNATQNNVNVNHRISFAAVQTPSLSQRAMLVQLSVGGWTGRKQDKRVTAETVTAKNAAADAGNWMTRIVPPATLAAIKSIENAARNYVYEVTLPWANNGPRILPSALFMEFTAKLRDFEFQFRQQVEAFLTVYPQIVEEAQTRLGDLYDGSKFPTVGKLRDAFSFSLAITPLPDAKDFRVDLSDEIVAEVQANIQQQASSALQNAMQEVWQRLYDAVEHIASKLADAKGKFKDSLIGNLVELLEILPALNITNDPALDRLRREAAQKLGNQDPQTLRDNPAVRADAANAAADILKQMSEFVG